MPTELQLYDLVVGVDFGTTYTGVAHAWANEPKNITSIDEWPGLSRSHECTKAPTEISYQGGTQWGYDIQKESQTYGWFKLRLDPDAGRQAYSEPNLVHVMSQVGDGNSSIGSLAPGKTAFDMTTDYLKLVYSHAMDTIRKNSIQRHFDSLRIKFVITTPAMWSPDAQDKTREAAEKAGFGSRSTDCVEMVSEPEAAANSTLRHLDATLEGPGSSGLKAAAGWEVGNQIMVCDAGGGTVDIVVYEITQIAPFLRVRETIRPQGALCGAAAVDVAFHRLLAHRLGNQAHLFTAEDRSRQSDIMEAFEKIKRNFGTSLSSSGQTVERIWHDMDGLEPIPEHNITSRKILLTHADIQSVFDPTVNRVLKLVEDVAAQVQSACPEKPLLGLVLVGGFGESSYLYNKLNEWGKAQTPAIVLSNPRDAWSAIAKGAVAFGLNSLHLDNRRLRCHYGVHLDAPYNPLIHTMANTRRSPWDDELYCTDTIHWLEEKNASIETDQRLPVPFQITSTGNTTGVLELQLVTSDYNIPPDSRRDTRATKLRPLRIDLSKVPRKAFEQCQKWSYWGLRSTSVFRSNFSLEMVVEAASLRFEVRMKSDGSLISTHRVGQLNADTRVLEIVP